MQESPKPRETVAEADIIRYINNASFDRIPVGTEGLHESEGIKEAVEAQVLSRLDRRSFQLIPRIFQLFPEAEKYPAVITAATEQTKHFKERRMFRQIPPVIALFSGESKAKILEALNIDEAQVEVYRENTERI